MRTRLTALNAIALWLAGSLASEGAAVARRSHGPQDGEARPHRRGKGGARDAKAAAEAERLVAEGQAALGAKDLAGARRALEQSLRVAASPEALFLLGQLAVAEGRLGFAHDLMRRFLHEQSGEPEGPQQKEAQKVLAQPAGPLGEVAVLGALCTEGVDAVLWQTQPVPGQALFRNKVGYGRGVPWSLGEPVSYDLGQYPETVRLLDSSIVLFSQTHPIAPQPSSLCEAYAEALAKVWLRLDEVLAATSDAAVPAGD